MSHFSTVITCLKEVRQTGRGHKLSKECNAELRNRMAMWAISKSVRITTI